MAEWKYLKYEIQERWARLAVREWINANPRIIVGTSIISVLIPVVIVIWQLTPEKMVTIEDYKKAWFYDLNTGKLFVDRSDKIAPIEAPSGPLPNGEPGGVKAYVFTYAYEPNEAERFIGFLETIDPNAEKDSSSSGKSRTAGGAQWGRGKLIRRVEDEQWLAGDSSEGRAILEEVLIANENGETAHYCRPE